MKPPKKVSKKAVKAVNKSRGQAVSKAYGKTVQKKTSPTRTIGYENTSPTKLPKSGTRTVGKRASAQAKSAQKRSRKM